MKSRTVRAWLIRAIGLALFGLVLTRIDFGRSLALLGRADPAILAAAALLIFPMMALKTVRWRWLQRTAGLRETSFTHSFLAYFTGMYAGLITPGRVGELVRVRYLTNRGAPLGPALSTVIWDRIIDVGGLFLIGLIALWPLSGDFRSLYLGAAGLAVLGAAGVALLVWKGGSGSVLAEALLRRIPRRGGRLGEKLGAAVPAFLGSLSGLRFPALMGMFVLTLAGWAVYYLQAWLLARTIGITLGLLPLVVSITAATTAAFLPVSISGLGTRDAALVILFQRFGRPGEEAMALSALIFLALIVNALLGFVASQILEWRPEPART